MGMSLFAEPIPAAQAAEWGMIWEVVEDEQLSDRATELALRLAKGPTRAYAAIRRSPRDGLTADYATQLGTEADRQGKLGQRRDLGEGVLSFLEKRSPEFEGR